MSSTGEQRPLVVTQNITVDGCAEMLGDWFDPADHHPDVLAEMSRQDETCDALLLGRQTFEDFRGYWPHQTEDTTGITEQLNAVTKYVVTSTMTDPEWQNSELINGDVLEAVRELKSQPGQDIVCTGSITLCHALLRAGLVDEIRLFTYPVVQGRGRRWFPDDGPTLSTRLERMLSFTNGVSFAGWSVLHEQ